MDTTNLENREIVISHLQDLFASVDLHKFTEAEPPYDNVYVRRSRLFGGVAFLLVSAGDWESKMPTPQIISECRDFIEYSLKAKRVFDEYSVNVVMIHEGNVKPWEIENTLDKSGIHKAILHSVVLMNVTNGEIHLKRSWIGPLVPRKVRRILHEIANTRWDALLHTTE